MPSKITTVVFLVILLLTAVGAFALGRESAKPSTSKVVSGLLFGDRWDVFGAGLLEDARRLYEGARLDICLRDTQTMADANEELRERLGTSERRLEESLEEKARIEKAMKDYYEQAKELSDKLYSTDCKEWGDAPVCPGIRGLLRSERGN